LILKSKLIFSNPKISISIQKIIIDHKNGHFNFEYFYVNMKIYISALKTFHLNLKQSFYSNLKFKFQIIILDSQNYYFKFEN
jgi:hypothetical protein